jgi:hypothetical protein
LIPVSAFGSVIAFNRAVDGPTAEELSKLFVEAVVAPGLRGFRSRAFGGQEEPSIARYVGNGGDDDRGMVLKADWRRAAHPNLLIRAAGASGSMEMC